MTDAKTFSGLVPLATPRTMAFDYLIGYVVEIFSHILGLCGGI